MQRQPTSLFLVAEAYRQELLADAGVVRPVAPWRLRRSAARLGDDVGRRQLGDLLIRLGQRLQGDPAATAARRGPGGDQVEAGSALGRPEHGHATY